MKAELYERSKLRKVIKGQGKTKKLSSSVDILVYLDYVLFMKELAKKVDSVIQESEMKKTNNVIERSHLETCLKKTLKEFRG